MGRQADSASGEDSTTPTLTASGPRFYFNAATAERYGLDEMKAISFHYSPALRILFFRFHAAHEPWKRGAMRLRRNERSGAVFCRVGKRRLGGQWKELAAKIKHLPLVGDEGKGTFTACIPL